MDYALEKELLKEGSMFITEIQDDNEISDSLNFRYNLGITLDRPASFEPSGLDRALIDKKTN